MPEMLTAEQVEALVAGAVEKAVRAANAVDPAARPTLGAPNVTRSRPHEFSLARTILALREGSWTGRELERDIVQATAEVYRVTPDRGEVAVPKDALAFRSVVEAASIRAEAPAFRDAGEGTTAAGGALVPPQYLQDQFVLSAQTAVAFRNAPGVQTIPVASNSVFLPRETIMPAAAAYAEAGTIANADPTFGQQNIVIKKQAVLNRFSNELLADSTPAFEAYLGRTLARSLAIFQDKQFLEGDGTGANVTGLAAYSGLTAGYAAAANGDSYSASGAADKLIDLVYALRAVGVEPNAWIMHPRTAQSLSKVKDTNGRYLLESFGGVFGAPVSIPNVGALATQVGYTPGPWRGMLLGMPVLFTTQIPITETQGTSTNATHIYLGDWNFAAVLERQTIELAMSEHINFTTDQTAVRVSGRAAPALTIPAAFVKQTGIIP